MSHAQMQLYYSVLPLQVKQLIFIMEKMVE